jgi:hypothetical protein
VVGKTRRWLASELIHELTVIDKKTKVAKQELTELVGTTGSRLLELHGIGPSGSARLLGDVGDIRRFASRAHFASGTAPPHSTRPPATTTATGSRALGTAASTEPCTSWPSSNSGTTPKDAAITAAGSPRANHSSKRSAP